MTKRRRKFDPRSGDSWREHRYAMQEIRAVARGLPQWQEATFQEAYKRFMAEKGVPVAVLPGALRQEGEI